MQSIPNVLINTAHIELWPARMLRARSNRDSRALAQSQRVLRRKSDGRYLAAELPQGVLPLVPWLMREPGIGAALDALDAHVLPSRARTKENGCLPLHGLRERLQDLGLDEGYSGRSGLHLVAEPVQLAHAGFDRYRRPLWLLDATARAWRRMQTSGLTDGIRLQAISGYRSHAYQCGIFERKLARGQTVDQILTVNAAPGYSEHHGGRALDIGTPGEPAAEESFEATAAFDWLMRRAGDFGFALSYPRGNRHGIVYEPWHWCWHPPR